MITPEQRATLARKNNEALVRLMDEFNFTLPTKTFHLWKPTKRISGYNHALGANVVPICTDGHLLLVLHHAPTGIRVESTTKMGFIGEVENLFTANDVFGERRARGERQPKPKKEKRPSWMDL